MTKTIVWCSHLDFTEGMSVKMGYTLKCTTIKVVHIPVEWVETDRPHYDLWENIKKWRQLHEVSDIIAGYFPQVAVDALDRCKMDLWNAGIITPIYSEDGYILRWKPLK